MDTGGCGPGGCDLAAPPRPLARWPRVALEAPGHVRGAAPGPAFETRGNQGSDALGQGHLGHEKHKDKNQNEGTKHLVGPAQEAGSPAPSPGAPGDRAAGGPGWLRRAQQLAGRDPRTPGGPAPAPRGRKSRSPAGPAPRSRETSGAAPPEVGEKKLSAATGGAVLRGPGARGSPRGPARGGVPGRKL